MKLHFLNPKIFFLTSITITYNPSLRLSSPLNNFNILPIYNSHFKTNYNRNFYNYKLQIQITNPHPIFLTNFTYHFPTFNHSTFSYSFQNNYTYLELPRSILLTTYRSQLLSNPFSFYPTSRLRSTFQTIHHSSFSQSGKSTNISPLMNNHGQLTRPVFHFQALVYRDGNLVSGSLEALVQHMVPTEEYYPDRAYLFAFLLSARLFIKPHELLGEVCALCEHQQNLNGEGGKVRPHESSSTLLVLHKSPTRAFQACTLRPPRALSFHRLEADSTPFSHSPPRRISLARPLSFRVVIMSTRIQARNVSLANEFPPPRFFLSRFVVSLSGNILSDFICVYIYFFLFFSRLIFVGGWNV